MSNRKTTLPTQTQLTGVAQTPGGEELSFKKTFWKWNGSDWNLKAKRGSCIANMYRKGVADKQVVFDPERTFDRRLCTGPWDSMGLLITRPKGMGRLIKAEQRRKDMAGERHRSSRKREWRACILLCISMYLTGSQWSSDKRKVMRPFSPPPWPPLAFSKNKTKTSHAALFWIFWRKKKRRSSLDGEPTRTVLQMSRRLKIMKQAGCWWFDGWGKIWQK